MREPTKRCIVNPSKIQTHSWAEQAKRLDWIQFPTKIKNTSFAPGDIDIRWYEDGILNVSYNCLDRHLQGRGDQTAIIWEGDDPSADEKVTYRDLYKRVCRFANGLRAQGVKKGDVVTLYMPMIPEALVAMLACTRIGAVHSIVFGGFSPDALAVRVEESGSKIIITADEGRRGGRGCIRPTLIRRWILNHAKALKKSSL